MPNDVGSARADPSIAAWWIVALSGLSRPQKTLPAKLFYDEEGCRLFYQDHRTAGVLPDPNRARIAAGGCDGGARRRCHRRAVLVEYGASDEGKADFLLAGSGRKATDAGTETSAIAAYVPIDVAMPALLQMRGAAGGVASAARGASDRGRLHGPGEATGAVAGLPRLGFLPGIDHRQSRSCGRQRFLALARGTLGQRRALPGWRRSAQGSVSATAGLRRCGRRHRRIQSQHAGAFEPRGRREFRHGPPSPIALSGTTRKAASKCILSAARTQAVSIGWPGSALRSRRDDPYREQLQAHAGALYRDGGRCRLELHARRGPIQPGCSHLFLLQPHRSG